MKAIADPCSLAMQLLAVVGEQLEVLVFTAMVELWKPGFAQHHPGDGVGVARVGPAAPTVARRLASREA